MRPRGRKSLRVNLHGSLRMAADGAASVDIEAANIRELFSKLKERFPDTAEELDNGIAVAIDGVVYRDDWTQPIPAQAAIDLIPRIAGG